MKYDPEDLVVPEEGELERAEIKRRDRDDGEHPRENGTSTREFRERERSRACAKRVPDAGGFCVLTDGHAKACKGIPEQYGPVRPPPDRKLMASFRAELSEKYDTALRPYDWVDRFGEYVPAGLTPATWWALRAMRAIR